MLKKDKKTSYKSLIIPNEIYIDNFENAKSDDAIKFSDWFFAQTKDRIEVLQNYINKSNDIFSLDYTDKSLIKLWTWFEDNLELVEKTDKELQNEKESTPQVYWKFIQNKRISPLMVEIAIDISYYFADMLLKKHSDLHTDCIIKPKWKENLKKPVISGFFMDITIYPIELIMESAKRSVEKKNPLRLKMIYDRYSDLASNPFKMKYDNNYSFWLISPYFRHSELLDFSQASKKTAEEFFYTYIGKSNERIAVLFNHIENDGIKIKKDFSPESLIFLWDWARKKITKRKLSSNEICEKELDYAPWFRNADYIPKTVISEFSCQLLIDLSYYYAEVLLKNYKNAQWSYFTNNKSYIDVNRPTISVGKHRIMPQCVTFEITTNLDDRNALYDAFIQVKKFI